MFIFDHVDYCPYAIASPIHLMVQVQTLPSSALGNIPSPVPTSYTSLSGFMMHDIIEGTHNCTSFGAKRYVAQRRLMIHCLVLTLVATSHAVVLNGNILFNQRLLREEMQLINGKVNFPFINDS
jgi:hypothetical protein